ncbi:MAG: glycosyltransferase family 4 protein [Candidatus Zixiibacteriota bacterium]|nr:MAG: glycosyltransferase family 4 protein [candidate division Zixibacteria bacterium]
MPEKIRLLKVTHNFPRWKGDYAGPFVSLLANRLLNHDIETVVVAPHHAGAEEEEDMDGVKVYRFRYASRDEDEDLAYHGEMHKLVLGSISGIFKFRHFLECFRKKVSDVIERERIDAIAGHWLVPAGMVLKTVAKKYNLPTFMYSHGTDVRVVRKYSNAAYRYLRSFCLGLNRWTVVSGYLKQQMVNIDIQLEDLIDVLPLPQDETVFYADDSVRKDDNLVVAVTRFTRQKRVDYLLRAFAILVRQVPEARMDIYGSGPLKPEMVQLIDQLGLQSHVNIFDPVRQTDLRVVYNRAAIVVLNSVEEGFGLALSEAMLCGSAVVGARSGGITDIIEHEKRGLLVEPDDAQQLADAMLRLLKDKPLTSQLAAAGHKFALANYASRPLAERYAEIIRNAFPDSQSP